MITKKVKFSSDKKEALWRLVKVETEIDNARDLAWDDPRSDRYEFCLHNFATKIGAKGEDEEVLEFGMRAFDAIYRIFLEKVRGEKELSEKGIVFKTKWGKAVGVLTANDQVLVIGEKQGYSLVVKQDPKTNHLRIYGRWDRKINLRKVFSEFRKRDSDATWYLHPSLCLLLNGSRSDPNLVYTKLSLSEIIEILKRG